MLAGVNRYFLLRFSFVKRAAPEFDSESDLNPILILILIAVIIETLSS